VITLAVNRGKATFDIIGGDADKFTLNDNKLTFKATALEDGNDEEIVTIASDDLKTCNYASGGNSTNRGINLRAFINAHRLISDANGFFLQSKSLTTMQKQKPLKLSFK
jgi:hypothetical protein